ncbi:hypothetical protein FBEOM_12939 [Fusarium beomiforme]|uniref:NAD(P)-binding domain-containing protein n=1 Tax=Fusarium beomiforme TaxID=44412 RepID=A0A9P5A6T7_9HYPO|nr:hypothetical protein FBEOM_12939 [Fusarium beomiforme]
MTVVGIAGVTSKIAQCIIKALQAYPDVTIKGLCRSPAKLPPIALQKYNIQVHQGSFDDQDAAQVFARGCDIVICCYYGGDSVMTQGQKVLIDACLKEGVPRYVPSDFAVDYTKIPDGELFPKQSTKTIKRYLEGKNIRGVHILVGALTETFWSPLFRLYDSQDETIRYWGTGTEKWELTTYETAAAYTAALVVDKNACGIFRFRGDRKSILEIKADYDRIYQGNLRLQCLGSLEDLYRNFTTQFRQDASDTSTWGPGCFAYWCTNGIAYLGDDLDNLKYPGVTPVNLEEFLANHSRQDLPLADQQIGF